MRKIFKNLSTVLFALILICVFSMPSNAMKYTDGRFITNMKVRECIINMVKLEREYKEITEEHEIYCDRIGFSFEIDKQSCKVRSVGVYVPVIDCELKREMLTFYVDLYPKNDLTGFELANLFLNSNDLDKDVFVFKISPGTSICGSRMNKVNKYYNMYSIATDVTEENWREKFLDPDIEFASGPKSLLFYEIRPGEKFFVEGYECDEDSD